MLRNRIHRDLYDDIAGSVRGRGGHFRRSGGVTGVVIEDVGLWWSCELQPRTEENPDDRDQHAPDRPAAASSNFPSCPCTDGSEQEDDLAFIARARDALARGEAFYYTSWW
jgi:hypothetical protein